MIKPYKVTCKGLRFHVLLDDSLLVTVGTFTKAKSLEDLLNGAFVSGYIQSGLDSHFKRHEPERFIHNSKCVEPPEPAPICLRQPEAR